MRCRSFLHRKLHLEDYMQDSWQAALDGFWTQARGKTAAQLHEELDILLGPDVPEANVLFERASLHDYLGEEAVAIGLYEQALASGLEGVKRTEAIIQLASSLRNERQPERAVQLLQDIDPADPLYIDAQGFLALAQLDAGNAAAALATALKALAPAMNIYSRQVQRYAQDLLERS